MPTTGGPRPWTAAAFNAYGNVKNFARAAFIGLRDKVASTVNNISESLDSAWIANLGVSLVALALTTAALLAVDIFLEVEHLSFVFLLPIFLIAIKFGKSHAVMASAASCLIAAFYFYTPKFSVFVDDPMHAAELACFCAMALMISKYAGARASEVMVH